MANSPTQDPVNNPSVGVKPKTIPVISIESQDFDDIARMSDLEVINHLRYVSRLYKKPIVPPKVRYKAARVSRKPDSITVHLLLAGRATARVRFVPFPAFRSPH